MYKGICILFLLGSFATYGNPLSDELDKIVKKNLPRSSVAIVFKDLNTNKILYQRNGNTLMNPASNIKLFTTAAALFKLKKDFSYQTALYSDGSAYFIKFTGAPDFRHEDLQRFLNAIVEKEGKKIKADIFIDDSQFSRPTMNLGYLMMI